MKKTMVYKDECMSGVTLPPVFNDKHLIFGIKLVTLDGIELELRAGNQWSLVVWDENAPPGSCREIAMGAALAHGDPAFVESHHEHWRTCRTR